MQRYQRKARASGEVELSMTAMLDMAFQLLAFFILTFHPAAVESQVSLRMPPAKGTPDRPTPSPLDPVKDDFGERTPIPMTVRATDDGEIARIEVGGLSIAGQPSAEQFAAALDAVMHQKLSEADFGGVQLTVSGNLLYERLMQVVDVCTRQTLKSGEPLTQVSISETGAGQ